MSKIDDVIKVLDEGGFQTAIAMADTEQVEMLMSVACPLFEQFHYASQTVALAAMLGMIFATIEGEPVEAEQDWGVIITKEDRLRMFVAMVWATYRDAMKERQATGAPQRPVN